MPRSRAPRAPQLGSSAMGLGHGRGPLSKRSGGRLAEPQGQGTPCRVPSQPLSTTLLDVLLCLDGQMTLESNKTSIVASVSKIASQRFKNYIDPTSVLREKSQKPKD